jgi:hypothetical protein
MGRRCISYKKHIAIPDAPAGRETNPFNKKAPAEAGALSLLE